MVDGGPKLVSSGNKYTGRERNLTLYLEDGEGGDRLAAAAAKVAFCAGT